MQARDVMTREVLTVGPETSAKYAGEVMAENGFAALPVVDDDDRLIGIVAEADVLRARIPPDPRLHVLRDGTDGAAPALVVRGVMTEVVRSVEARTDVADVARLFVDDRLRSVPVVEGDRRVVGIISRRDVLHALVRPDDDIRRDLLHLVESYSGEAGAWDQLRDHAHALKGVASNMGLMQLAATSGDLMRVAEWQLRRDWRQRLQTLHEQFAIGRAALDARGLSGAARDRGREP